MSDPFYRAFEDEFRGSRDTIKQRLKVYAMFLRALRETYPAGPVLDLGCGRGEWLELTQEHGFKPLGIDLDAGMLQACRDIGLNTLQGDALEYLAQSPDESQVVISAFHLVEHLTFDQLRSLVIESLRVLKPGGLLIMETPNPENIQVATNTFYFDPTHERPVPPGLLSFLTAFCGFSRNKILRLQESPEVKRRKTASLYDVLTAVSPDYAVVAQKHGPADILERADRAFSKDVGLTLNELCKRHDQANATMGSGAATFGELEAKVEHTLAQAEHALELAAHAQDRAMRMEQAFQSLHASRSWQLTRPLRWANLQFSLLRAHGPRERLTALARKLSGRRVEIPTIDASPASEVDVSAQVQPGSVPLSPHARTIYRQLIDKINASRD